MTVLIGFQWLSVRTIQLQNPVFVGLRIADHVHSTVVEPVDAGQSCFDIRHPGRLLGHRLIGSAQPVCAQLRKEAVFTLRKHFLAIMAFQDRRQDLALTHRRCKLLDRAFSVPHNGDFASSHDGPSLDFARWHPTEHDRQLVADDKDLDKVAALTIGLQKLGQLRLVLQNEDALGPSPELGLRNQPTVVTQQFLQSLRRSSVALQDNILRLPDCDALEQFGQRDF